MPLYFFHVHYVDDFPDTTGLEFPDDETAGGEAVRAAGNMVSDLGRKFLFGTDWTMTVVDERDDMVCELRFSGQIRRDGGGVAAVQVPEARHGRR